AVRAGLREDRLRDPPGAADRAGCEHDADGERGRPERVLHPGLGGPVGGDRGLRARRPWAGGPPRARRGDGHGWSAERYTSRVMARGSLWAVGARRGPISPDRTAVWVLAGRTMAGSWRRAAGSAASGLNRGNSRA